MKNIEKLGLLIGTYECKIDAKGRLMVPSVLRKQLNNLEDGFVLRKHSFSNCLEVYPMPEWNKVSAKINKINRHKKENAQFVRKFMSGVRPVEIDTNGRLLVPKDLVNLVELKKELVLLATGTTFEIWDKDLYEEENNFSDEDFAAMEEKIMGGQEDDE